MELVYFWLEEFGDKNNQDINFNQNYTFKVEKQDEKYFLKMEENNNKIPDNYFGEKISNISCIIGENGSGKTTLIRQILRAKYLKKSLLGLFPRYILILKKNNKLEIRTNIEKEKLKAEKESNLYELNIIRVADLIDNNISDGLADDHSEIKYIYFSNDFNPISESFISTIFDISIKNKLKHKTLKEEKNDTNITGLDFIETLYDENMREIAMFIIDYGDEFIKKIPYDNLKSKLKKIKDERKLSYEVKEQFSRYAGKKIFEKIYNKINVENNNLTNDNLKNNKFIEKFILNTWIYISNFIFKDIEEKRFLEKNIDLLIQRKKNEQLEEWFEKQLEILEKLTSPLSFSSNNIKKSGKKWEALTVDIDKIKLLYKYIKEKCINNEKLEINYIENQELVKNIKETNRLINLIKFKFKDGFSNGEYILIYLLKEIFELKDKIGSESETEGIVFFLEEAESFLHPEWQRRLIELLKTIAENCPWLGKRKIQFILTSHTPFLVGDLPKGNVKRIENFEIKELEENPFGDNLLNIFKSQFNLESLFGEFTRKKIRKYAKKLKEDKQLLPEEKEEVKFLINNIEEPLIRSSLKELYEKTFSKEERIKFLEEEIKKLKEEKNAEVK